MTTRVIGAGLLDHKLSVRPTSGGQILLSRMSRHTRGDRLVFSNGATVLAVLAGGVVIIFRGHDGAPHPAADFLAKPFPAQQK